MEMFDNHIRELVNGESIRIRFTDRMKNSSFLKKLKQEEVYQNRKTSCGGILLQT